MPRRPRTCLPGIPSHVYVRGNDHHDIFRCDGDRLAFRHSLLEASKKRGVAIHAYVFMTNHVHLIATGDSNEGVGLVVQDIGRTYVRYFNARHGRSGTLWEGRFKSNLIGTEKYYFNCHCYIEQNPVRAGMVRDPFAYPWSSIHHYGAGVPDDLVTRHAVLDAMNDGPAGYRSLISEMLPASVVEEIRHATKVQVPFGSLEFQREMELATGRVLTPGKRGWTLGKSRKEPSGLEIDVLTPLFPDP